MANFQFTVRATDSDGAYADRNFGITVNNTRVERYMVIDGNHAYTSPDLVSWTTRNGQGGWDCVYGNGQWLILTNNNTNRDTNSSGGMIQGGGAYSTMPNSALVVRKSLDGVNYTAFTQNSGAVTLTLPSGTVLPTTPTTNQVMGKLSFSNGYFWMQMLLGDVGSTSPVNQYVARSADGLAWTLFLVPARGSFVYDSTNGHYLRNFTKVQDSGSDIFIGNLGNTAQGGSVNIYGWRSSDLGATWIPVTDSTGKSNGVSNYVSPMITRVNGLWLAAGVYTAGIPFMVSNDGVNWSACNTVAGHILGHYVHDVVYANGTLYAAMNRNNTASSSTAYYLASNDGINWTQTGFTNMSSNGAAYSQYTNMFYKNGYLVFGNNGTGASSQRPFGYTFAGTTDSMVLPGTPNINTTTGPQVPFNYVVGMAAMGS